MPTPKTLEELEAELRPETPQVPKTLEELDEVKSPALVSLAVRFGKTRLIDNVVLE